MPNDAVTRSLDDLLRLVESWTAPVTSRELAAALSGPLPLAELLSLARYSPDARTRVRLCRTEHAEVLLLGWRPGQRAPMHGHHGSQCALRVIQGAASETLAEGREPMRVRTRTLLPGDLAVVPLSTQHEVVNTDSRDLLTLHIYSPPLPPPEPEQVTTAIIGGGASGVAVARSIKGGRILLFEGTHRLARGRAYTADPHVVLNVPANQMGIDADDPEGFVRFAPELDPTGFAPRARYGEYLEHALAELGDRVTRCQAEVVDLQRVGGLWRLHFNDGAFVARDRVVLATGHGPAANVSGIPPVFRADARCVLDPAAPGALDRVGPENTVLVVGTGLTFLDTLAVLRSRGHEGQIIALSRHGLLPRPHGSQARVPGRVIPAGADPLAALRAVRAAAATQPWQEVINAVRDEAADVWASWSDVDRGRFLRHLRPWWEVYRHRAPVEALAWADALRRVGLLELGAGRILGLQRDSIGLRVSARLRGGATRTFTVQHIVLAVGPEQRPGGPLYRALHERKILREDPLGIGVPTDHDGRAAPHLYVVGPNRRTESFDVTSIPDIRVQAKRLATLGDPVRRA